MKEFITAIIPSVVYTDRTLKEKIQSQITHLGYIDISNKKYSGIAAVLSVDTKYAPKLKMYSLKNGTTLMCKIDKQTFNKNKLTSGDIIIVKSQTKKPKVKRTAEGKYEPIQDTSEVWIKKYIKANDL